VHGFGSNTHKAHLPSGPKSSCNFQQGGILLLVEEEEAELAVEEVGGIVGEALLADF
jgi:hypothetical protein